MILTAMPLVCQHCDRPIAGIPTTMNGQPYHYECTRSPYAQLSKPQPTSQDTANAERWRHFACDQTALILGSKLSPSDTNVNWLEECNKLADAAMKEGK